MAKTYDNTIVEEEVSLAIERLLIANSTNTYNPETDGKIDIDTPPTGFTDVGAVVEDSPTLTVTREKYQLRLGLPRALQYEQIIGVDGEFAVVVWAKSNDVVAQALGVDAVTCTIATNVTRVPFGRTTIKKYGIIGIADFVDGTQVVHYFDEVSVKPEYSENIRPDEAGRIMMGFDCYSHISTIHGDERIVGERFYFNTTV